jgi:nucleotide-binding universal stress UspA family protein/CheY-like chemotaxis protein
MVTTAKGAQGSRLSRGHRTIVCVDDEPLVSRALYRLLSREPYDVLLAETPRQALRYVKDYEVDLVITDQRMPDMSGVELLSEVRQVSPSTTGLILTAYPESVLVDDPPDPPAPPLFAKPWDDETLCEGIREVLKAGPPTTGEERKLPPRIAVRTVLVPVDGSIEPELALGSVLPLLKSESLRIILLQVLPHLGLHRDVYARLERMRSNIAAEGVDAIADVRWGDPTEQILLHARHADADLIVLSTHERKAGFFRRSVAERILDEGDVPLLVGKPDLGVRTWKRILVPLDGTRDAESALADAVRLAKSCGATIEVIGVTPVAVPVGYGYVPHSPRVQDRMPYLSEIVKYLEFEDVSAEARSVEGDPAGEILRRARESGTDLICMTTKVRSGWSRFLFGGVARELLRRAPCPIFVRRA